MACPPSAEARNMKDFLAQIPNLRLLSAFGGGKLNISTLNKALKYGFKVEQVD